MGGSLTKLKTVEVEVEVDISEFETDELIAELRRRKIDVGGLDGNVISEEWERRKRRDRVRTGVSA